MLFHPPAFAFDTAYRKDDTIVVRQGGWVRVARIGGRVLVREGTRTDLASVPRIFRFFASKLSLGVRAPLIHDMLYRSRGWAFTLFDGESSPGDVKLTRREADAILRDLAPEDGRRRHVVWAAWLAVRVGGWVYWW